MRARRTKTALSAKGETITTVHEGRAGVGVEAAHRGRESARRGTAMRCVGWIAAALLAGVATPVVAQAQSTAAVVDGATADHDRARRAYERGNRAMKQGRYADAEAAYLEAWAVVKAYDVAANLGLAALKLNKPREAAERLAYGLRAAPLDVDRKRVARLRELLAEAKQKIGTLEVPPIAEEIELWIDGVRVGDAQRPEEVFVDAGTHRVVTKGRGYAETEVRLEAPPGSVQDVTPTLVPLPPPKASAPPPPPPQPVGERSAAPVLVMSGLSAAWLAVGIGTTLASNSASDEAAAHRAALGSASARCDVPPASTTSRCVDLAAAAWRRDGLGNAARVAYVMSGALALGAVTYALWPRAFAANSSALRVRPAGVAGGAGVALVGSW